MSDAQAQPPSDGGPIDPSLESDQRHNEASHSSYRALQPPYTPAAPLPAPDAPGHGQSESPPSNNANIHPSLQGSLPPQQQLNTPISGPYYQSSQNTYQTPASIAQASLQPSPAASAHAYHPVQQSIQDGSTPQFSADPNQPTDVRRARACESCRNLKVRCDRTDESSTCRRCARTKRVCTTTLPNRKRQRKDTRVAELEKKVEQLQRGYHAGPPGGAGGPGGDPGNGPIGGPHFSSPGVPVSNSHSSIPRGSDAAAQLLPVLSQDELRDRIMHCLGDADQRRAFASYNESIAPLMPAVVFARDDMHEEIRATKPLLYLAVILTGGIGATHPDTQEALTTILLNQLGAFLVTSPLKSLEVIQAVVVFLHWYRAPNRSEKVNFSGLIQNALVLAYEIGLGKKFRGRSKNDGLEILAAPVSESLEARRAFLGLYFLVSTSAMSLRRPQSLTWNSYIEESIAVLESGNEEQNRYDRILCQHARLQHITERINHVFYMDDASFSLDLRDARVQGDLKKFEAGLEEWKRGNDVTSPTLDISFALADLFMHEMALHVDHNADDFKTEQAMRGLAQTPAGDVYPAQADAIRRVFDGVLSVFHGFNNASESVIHILPVFCYIRVAYAVVLLLQLHFGIVAANSPIAKVLSVEDLNVQERLLALYNTLLSSGNVDHGRPSIKLFSIVDGLRSWFDANTNNSLDADENRGISSASLQMLSDVAAGQNYQRPPTQASGGPTPAYGSFDAAPYLHNGLYASEPDGMTRAQDIVFCGLSEESVDYSAVFFGGFPGVCQPATSWGGYETPAGYGAYGNPMDDTMPFQHDYGNGATGGAANNHAGTDSAPSYTPAAPPNEHPGYAAVNTSSGYPAYSEGPQPGLPPRAGWDAKYGSTS